MFAGDKADEEGSARIALRLPKKSGAQRCSRSISRLGARRRGPPGMATFSQAPRQARRGLVDLFLCDSRWTVQRRPSSR
jgi:hypothetical protein